MTKFDFEWDDHASTVEATWSSEDGREGQVTLTPAQADVWARGDARFLDADGNEWPLSPELLAHLLDQRDE